MAMTGNLHIVAARKNNRTYLESVYCTPPFKLANITGRNRSHKLHLMIMSASPGILDGDVYNLKVELAAGCAVELGTQSYQRLFQMKSGALQTMNVQMSANSSLCFLPHPVVPHKASSFSAHNRIYLSDNCGLIWGEVLTCGRQLNGEVFSFTRYQNKTEIYLHDRLVVKENLFLQPATMTMNSMGQMEGYTHQASFIFIDEEAPIKDVYTELSALLSFEQDVCYGVSLLPINGLTVRLLGYKGEQLYDCLKRMATLLQSTPVLQKEHSFTKPVFYAD